MQTKGGYSGNEIHSHLNLIDLPKLSWHPFCCIFKVVCSKSAAYWCIVLIILRTQASLHWWTSVMVHKYSSG